ncbi:VOC family protein [Isoptericola sp. 4D.3]|uniref:VOC family protein n=1 Tax=Isoptericola peretonis TaxID=2918523 RepID=A0ABT0IYE7_9MICO|nr:VOC family protein [Isoptericola sp. 4D.3]
MPIGRLHHLVIDGPDPHALAAFWSAVLGQAVTYAADDFVVVARSDRESGLAFQRARDHQPPDWGDPARPQQMHLDVMVDDVAAAHARVLALGAHRLTSAGPGAGEGDVYADPAGHPFCLVPRPGWAPPVEDGRP